MKVLEFVNYVLSLCGEQPLLSTAGNLGALARNAINSSILTVVQTSRASFFEQQIVFNATNDDYLVSIGQLSDSVAQVLQAWLLDASTNTLIGMKRVELQALNNYGHYYSYEVVGRDVFINKAIIRPCFVHMRVLSIPTLPLADDSDLNLPNAVIPAVAHTAAAILLISYIDDANAASMHQNLAATFIDNLRLQFGTTRARVYSMSNTNNRKNLLP